MASSESEDFESADEGPHDGSPNKKERKKRLSSSNYSEPTNEPEEERKKVIPTEDKKLTSNIESTDGWDDFDIEESDKNKGHEQFGPENSKIESTEKVKEKEMDTGWDDFGDWGQDDVSTTKSVQEKVSSHSSQDIKSVADRLSQASVSEQKPSTGWGWGGWGVDSLLSSATAGITSITSQVSQGISTVLETGIGAPDPEEMARKNFTPSDDAVRKTNIEGDEESTKNVTQCEENASYASDGSFPFGSLISGVTKFVETTGTKVIAGGLDTLETIGKKTMEVLQDGDPGLAKKRAMLGLDAGDKIVLSQVLREAKSRADEEDRVREEKREAKAVHYETLFDDFEGLVHLEALEMLSRQVNMRLDDRLQSVDAEKRLEIRETLQQVAELCEIPDDDDDDDVDSGAADPESFHLKLQEATQDLGLKLHFQPLVKQYTEVLEWLQTTDGVTEKIVYKHAVSGLAQCTALCVELYHKAAEMLLVKNRRSTADEADALTQMTVVLTRHVSDLATRFTEKLNAMPIDNKELINNYINNVFLEAGNSSTYIQNAFQLALPILQIGAA